MKKDSIEVPIIEAHSHGRENLYVYQLESKLLEIQKNIDNQKFMIEDLTN